MRNLNRVNFSSQQAETNSADRQPTAAPDSGPLDLRTPGLARRFSRPYNRPDDTREHPRRLRGRLSPLSHADLERMDFCGHRFSILSFHSWSFARFFICQAGRKGIPNSAFVVRILRRTIILFALGLFVNIFPSFHLSTIRIPGVLQRIALCYFFASLIVLKAGLRGRILWLIGLLASYWLMMRFIPVPGIGAGVLEPGQNFAAWVDSHFLNGYMWSYYDGTWDPEGIVSTIPAIATTLFGVLDGTMAQVFFVRAQESCRNGMRRAGSAHRRSHTGSLAADKQEHMDEHLQHIHGGAGSCLPGILSLVDRYRRFFSMD